MKKVITIILAVMLVVAFSACGNDSNDTSSVKSPTFSTPSQTQTASSSTNSEWKEFLKDYEDWVDDYIAIVEKYKNNPTDMSILSDYTEMMSELTEWSSEADKIQNDLSADDLQEYLETVSRITQKLAQAAY